MLMWWISCMVFNGEILWKLSVSVMVNIHNKTTFHLEQIFTHCPLTPKFRLNSTFSRQGLTWGLKKVSSILFQSGNEEKTLVIPEYYRLLSYHQPSKQTSACRSEREVMDVLNSAEVAELWKVFATDEVFCEAPGRVAKCWKYNGLTISFTSLRWKTWTQSWWRIPGSWPGGAATSPRNNVKQI